MKNTNTTFWQVCCRFGYSVLLFLLLPLFALMLRKRRGQDTTGIKRTSLARFGLVEPQQTAGGYLFHCVSVGEVTVASCVIKALQCDQPKTPIIVTTTTPTGANKVIAEFGDSVTHHYLPFDLPFAMAVFLKRIKPKVVVITEVELWPNLINQCFIRGIPTVLMNGRLTERSAKTYQKFGSLFLPMFNQLSHICAQGERDWHNYLSLGVLRERLTLTNNLKFAQAATLLSSVKPAPFLGIKAGFRPVIVAGSTHEPEESTMLEAMTVIWQTQPSALLLLVPRHPERFSVVAEILDSHNLHWQRSSSAQEVQSSTQVILVDEMGKLMQAYHLADCAFVGGSIANKGGHNALEPAALSLPILMGPNTYNNPVICKSLEEAGALYIVNSSADISTLISRWLENPSEAEATGQLGFDVLEKNGGALEKTLQVIGKTVS